MIHAINNKQVADPIRREDHVKLRSEQRMENVLLEISVNLQTENKYFEIWKRFEEPTLKLRESNGLDSQQLKVVLDLAKRLLR